MEIIELFNQEPFEALTDRMVQAINKEILSSKALILKMDSNEMAHKIGSKYQLTPISFDKNKLGTNVKRVLAQSGHFREIVETDIVEYKYYYTGSIELITCKPDNSFCRIGYQLNVGHDSNHILFEIPSNGLIRGEGEPMRRVKMIAQGIFDYIDCSVEAINKSVDKWNSEIIPSLENNIGKIKSYLQEEQEKQKNIEKGLNPFL